VTGEVDPNSLGSVRCERCGLLLTRDAVRDRAVLGRVSVKRVRPEDLPDGPVVMGAVLEELPGEFTHAEAAGPSGPPELIMPTRTEPLFRCAVVAEDTELHRSLIRDGLTQHHLAEQVV